MTLGEFRAFLEGMDIEEAPTKAQWARLMEKLAKVQEATPITWVAPLPCAPAIPWMPPPVWGDNSGPPHMLKQQETWS